MRTSLIFSSIDKWLLQRVHDATGGAQIRLALNNGNGFSPPRAAPVASVLICDRRTLARLFFDPEVGFGDAYAEGHIQVEGNLVALLEAAYKVSLHLETLLRCWKPPTCRCRALKPAVGILG